MKEEYKKNWKRSKQARKQRKYRANAPHHTKSKFLHAHLSDALREKHGKKSLRIREGDEAEVMRGSFKGEKGVVERVDTDNARVFIRGVEIVKPDGNKLPQSIAVSNLRLTKLEEDKRRIS